MTGVQIVGIAVISLVVIFLVAEYFMANFMATYILTPPSRLCPTPEQIKERKTCEISAERAVYADADFDAYEEWETERFFCENNGIHIPAVFHPLEHARGCAILAHGFGQNRYAMVPYAEVFRKLGFSTVLFDERRFGESNAPYGTFGIKEATDVAALTKWVKQRCGKDTKIVLLGVSMGAVSVMNALKYTDDVDYVVEDCGFVRVSQGLPFVYRSMVHIPNPFLMPVVKKRAKKYGFDMLDNNPIDVVKNSKVPICVVHGDMDRAVSVECAKELGTVMKNPKSRVEIYEGRDHAYSICDKERYTRMLSDFLDEMFVFPVEQEEEHGK